MQQLVRGAAPFHAACYYREADSAPQTLRCCLHACPSQIVGGCGCKARWNRARARAGATIPADLPRTCAPTSRISSSVSRQLPPKFPHMSVNFLRDILNISPTFPADGSPTLSKLPSDAPHIISKFPQSKAFAPKSKAFAPNIRF